MRSRPSPSCSATGAPPQEVEQLADAFLASEAVIPLGAAAKGERFTTERIWELERAALAKAERMAERPTRRGRRADRRQGDRTRARP